MDFVFCIDGKTGPDTLKEGASPMENHRHQVLPSMGWSTQVGIISFGAIFQSLMNEYLRKRCIGFPLSDVGR